MNLNQLNLFISEDTELLKTLTFDDNVEVFYFPEHNKHPRSQVTFIRNIVEKLDSEKNIVIITHSDYIAREINNFMMLYISDCQEYDSYGYTKKHFLNPNNISAFMLYENKTIECEQDKYGFYFDTFDNFISEHQGTSNGLAHYIYDS